MKEGKNREAMELLKRILTAPWTQEHKVWDEDVYWRLRLLSYICKRRTQEQVSHHHGIAFVGLMMDGQ